MTDERDQMGDETRAERHGDQIVEEPAGSPLAPPGEAEGRMIEAGAPAQLSEHAAGAEVAIGAAFVVAMVAAVSLAVVYALGGQPQAEGALLATTLGGIGFGVICWAKFLMANGPFVQQREPLTSTRAEREGFEESFERGREEIGRRRVLGGLLAGALAALGGALVFPIRSLGPSPGRSLTHTTWSPGARLVDASGQPVKVGDVAVGGLVTVFPDGFVEDASAQTVLIHVADQPVVTKPGREDWSPSGYLAFSKVCTHAGCPVGLYQQKSNQLLCPCHQSLFDVSKGAKPVFGPAPRSLPQLPLAVDAEGNLVAQRDYEEPIGPSFWNRA